MSLKTRLTVLFLLAAIIPLIAASLLSLYFMNRAQSIAFEESKAALGEMGESQILASAMSTARQVELYLEMKPEIDQTDGVQLENDSTLAKIAVQPVGQTGYTAVFDENAITHFHSNPKVVGMDMHQLSNSLPDFWAIFEASLDGAPASGYYDWKEADGSIRAKYMQIVPVGKTRLRVAATTYIDEFVKPVGEINSKMEGSYRYFRVQLLLLVGVVAMLSILFAYLLSEWISRPIQLVAEAVKNTGTGDFRPIEMQTRGDEIGVLVRAYNTMTEQLSNTLDRLTRRNREIETASEVSRRLSTILDQTELIAAVVEELRQVFNYYHAHIYLFDEAGGNLVMVGGTGEVGQQLLDRGHKIPKGRGLVGRAAESGKAVLVTDTAADPNWLPNPLLPETRSEVAVPIVAGGRVLGVLDVQQNTVGGLKEQDVELLTSVANQVAVAVRNARLYTQSQRQAERELRVNLIGQKVQQSLTVEDTLQIALRELSQALDAPRASIQVGGLKGNGDGRARK